MSATGEMQTIDGVLLLVDLCGSTAAQAEHGSPAFQRFRDPVRDTLISLENITGFRLLEDQGDGFMLFRLHRLNDNHSALLDLFSEMQRLAPQLSTRQFDCALRYVAHYSGFQATPDADGYPRNIQSVEAIRIFRAEKLATSGDLLVTHELMARFGAVPEQRKCSVESVRLSQPLKGLEILGSTTTVFYRIRLPRHADALDLQFPQRYRKRRNLLGEECRKIPVFGRAHAAVPMDGNFIHLTLDHVSHRVAASDFEGIRIGNSSAHPHHPADSDASPARENHAITPADLETSVSHGIILGLPGAGKTTILRHLVHRTLEREATAPLILVEASDLTSSHADACPFDDGGTTYTPEGAIRFLLSAFLWPGDLVDSLDAATLETTARLFHVAWRENEAIVLLDALDEARSAPLRHRLIHATKVLFRSLPPEGSMPSSRIFLTARRQYRSQLDLEGFRILEIDSLDLGELPLLARSVFDPIGKRQIADRFVAELPNHPAAMRLGGTPMMALLLLFLFEAAGGWSSRFGIYDTVLRFILLNVWEKAKRTPGIATIREFFNASLDANFSVRFPEVGLLYDALAATGFDALFGPDPQPLRRLTQDDLHHYLADWIAIDPARTGLPSPRPGSGAPPEQCMAAAWYDALFTAGMFVPADSGHFAFIHASVLEFLAARHLADAGESGWPAALANPDRDTLETFPILCSRDWRTGHRILALLPQHVPDYRPESLLAFSCLAESEVAESRELSRFNAEAHRRPLREQMDGPTPKDPVFQALAITLWSDDPDILHQASGSYAASLPLTRDVLLTRHASRDGKSWSDDPALRESRAAFLRAILHRDLHEKHVEGPLRMKQAMPRTRATPTGQPTNDLDAAYLDRIKIHRGGDFRNQILSLRESPPPSSFDLDDAGNDLDQNLAYHRAAYSPAIIGFLGSPDFRANGATYQPAISPDGQIIASGDDSGLITLWDTATGREIRSFSGHVGSVLACAWHPEGKILASASSDKTLRLWDSRSGREILSFHGHLGRVRSCAWHPDGKTLASASDDQTLRLWDSGSGREIRSLRGHLDWVLCCAWHPGGKTLASTSADQTLRLWDVAAGRETRSISGHSGSVLSCAWQPGGEVLASSSSDQTVRLWDSASGHEILTISGHTDRIRSCAWHPDGMILASASDDQSLRLWEVATGREIRSLRGPSAKLHACVWHPDGKSIAATCSDQNLHLWDAASGREIRSLQGHAGRVRACAWHPEGKVLASASSDLTLRLWDADSGREIRMFQGHSGSLLACAWHPNGKTLASTSSDQSLRFWDVAAGREIRSITGHTGSVLACAWQPNGKSIASASSDQTLRLWDTVSGRELHTLQGHSGRVRACCWHPDGKTLASASEDQSVRLWDVASGREIRLLHGHSDQVLACAWHLDGEMLASASADHSLRLWDTGSGREIRSLHGHAAPVRDCAWQPDSNNLASVSSDRTLRLWEAATGTEILTMQLPSLPQSVAFHPGNQQILAAALRNGTSVIVDLSCH